MNISKEGKRNLGSVIGSKNYKDQYCKEKISKWKEEFIQLTEVAKSQPHPPSLLIQRG